MFKRIILTALVTVTITLFSTPVGRSEAETAAKNWLNGRTETKDYISVSEYINYSDAVHIFNFKDGVLAQFSVQVIFQAPSDSGS